MRATKNLLKMLNGGEKWMTDKEKAWLNGFISRIRPLLRARGIPETALLVLRVDDVAVSYLMVKRVEAAFVAAPEKADKADQAEETAKAGSEKAAKEKPETGGAKNSKKAADAEAAPTPPPAKEPPNPLVAAEAVGKARERMRKAMKELEDFCDRAGKPIEEGLADTVKPIMKKTEGLAEKAWLRAHAPSKAEES